jgi:hypothetical protein
VSTVLSRRLGVTLASATLAVLPGLVATGGPVHASDQSSHASHGSPARPGKDRATARAQKKTQRRAKKIEEGRAALATRASVSRAEAKHWQVADLVAHLEPGEVAFVAKGGNPVMFTRTDTGLRLHTPDGVQTVPAEELTDRVDRLAGAPVWGRSRRLAVTTKLASAWWNTGPRWSLSTAVELTGTLAPDESVLFGRTAGQWLVLTHHSDSIEITGPDGARETVGKQPGADLARVQRRWPQVGLFQPLTPVEWLRQADTHQLPRLPVDAALELFYQLPWAFSPVAVTVRFDTHQERRTYRLSWYAGRMQLQGPGTGRLRTAAPVRRVSREELEQTMADTQRDTNQMPLVGLGSHLPKPGEWEQQVMLDVGPGHIWWPYYNG